MVELTNIYAYAFLGTPEIPLELPVGMGGDRLLLISTSGISALVEPGISVKSWENDDEKLIKAVVSHDRVLCELFAQTTVLPLRFGVSFVSEENLLSHLESHRLEYLEKLKEIEGKAEYTLKFIPKTFEEPKTPAKGKGKEYFLAKKQRYQTQQNFLESQASQWEEIAAEIKELHPTAVIMEPEGEELRKVHLLIGFQEESLLAEQFLTWQEFCSYWELQLGGALPPYHFI